MGCELDPQTDYSEFSPPGVYPKLLEALKQFTEPLTSPPGLSVTGLQLLLSQESMDQTLRSGTLRCPALALLRWEEGHGNSETLLSHQRNVGNRSPPMLALAEALLMG